MESSASVRIGTCSWNYDSWVGLVYSKARRRAADYLSEYSNSYDSVEVDSWFYKLPDPAEVEAYYRAVPGSFSFTCKAPQLLTQACRYGSLEKNELFLSPAFFAEFHDALEPFKDKIECVILEFEYLNKQKMAGPDAFRDALGPFLAEIPRDIPVGVECRNANYLDREYFEFLAARGVSHVFSEKLYMPSIVSLMDSFHDLFTQKIIIRLLGGDRKEIEKLSQERWNAIVDKKDLAPIVERVRLFAKEHHPVVLNVNNHYEGSAPLTIREIRALLAG
jgi:uncharacterized protein YecE (DUF72 family)